MNQRKIGIILNYLNIFLNVAIGLIYVPLLLTFIGKQEYGLYQLMGSVIAYFGIMDFGLGAAVARYYKQYLVKQEALGCENILGLAMRIFSGIGVLMLVLGGAVYFNLEQIFHTGLTAGELALAQPLFLCLLFNIILNITSVPFQTVINAHECFLFAKGLNTLKLILQPCLVWLILCQYPSALSVVLVQSGLNILLMALYLYYCFTELKVRIRYHHCEAALLKDFSRMAFNTFVVAIIDQFFYRTNQIVLGIISGTNEVAVYALGAYIYNQYIIFSCAIIGVYFPYVNELIATNASSKKLSVFFIKMGRRQFLVLAAILSGFIIFGQQFIGYWAGPSFEAAYYVAILVMVPCTIDLIQNAGILILQAKNQYGFRAQVYFVAGLLHLALSVYMGRHWGLMGCAWATFMVILLSNGLVMNWYYYNVQKLDIPGFWLNIIGLSLKISLFAVPVYFLNSFTYSAAKFVFLGKMALYGIGYIWLCYKYWLNAEEREEIQKTRFLNRYFCPKPKLQEYPELQQLLQQPLSTAGLAGYAEACLKLNTCYIWGSLGRYVDAVLLDHVQRLYPDHYTPEKLADFKKLYGKKALAFDCIGLIKSYYMGGPGAPKYVAAADLNTEAMWEQAIVKGPMKTLPEQPGTCLYMEGHVGIYMGKGRVIEATSNPKFGNGVVESKLEARAWEGWFICPFIDGR